MRFPLIVVGVVAALTGWTGCTSGPASEELFAQAEQLRLRYEKDASREAIAKYQEAMTAWKRKGDSRDAARAGQGIGATYEHIGLLHESLEAYQAALSVALESPDRVLESEIRSAVGVAQALVTEREEMFDQAREQCQRALELARAAGSGRAEATALNCLGEVAYYRFRPEEALELYVEAGRVWDTLGDRRGQAQTAMYQGTVYSDLSRFDQARSCYEKARGMWISLGDEREQAITLVADARLKLRLGEYQDALDKFQNALNLLAPMGDGVWEGSALTGVARVYLDMADTGSALKYWERALQIFETTGLKHIAVDVLMSLGATYLASGDDTRALSRFERALTLANELGIERWRAIALRFIGVVYLFRQLPTQAREHLEDSLAAQGSVDDPRLEAETRADLGEARILLGQPKLAARYFNTALDLSRAAGDRVTEARGLFGLARTSAGVGDLDRARRHVEGALSVAESLRTATENRDLRAAYFASVYRYHEFHMDVLMRLNRASPRQDLAPAAFAASERARSRSLLDRLSEAGVDLRQGVDPELLRREDELKRAFDDWAERQRRVANAPAHDREAESLAEEYLELERRYGQVQGRIRAKSPHYAALAQPQPLTLREIQSQVLDADTLLLEYALGDERSYLWAVSHQDHSSYELPPRAQIERAAQRTYARLTARLAVTGDARTQRRQAEQADAEYWTEATSLSEMLLGPVATKIAGKKILVISDGALQYVPFAALPVPGGRSEPVPMVVEHQVVGLPSASVLAVLRRETRGRTPPRNTVAVLADPVFERDDPRLAVTRGAGDRLGVQPSGTGDVTVPPATLGGASPGPGPVGDANHEFPRLVATRQEADAILATAPEGTTLRAIGFEASRATAMSPELAHYRIVHFATHGVFNNESPGLSGIVLSMLDERGRTQDGFLRLHDIYGLQLPAELVVLSACDTALGKQVRGEGLVGVVRGFMYAGAKRVVASLWKVDDEATGQLMRVFYREMLEKGRPPGDALRQAQLSLRRGRRWREPFYWAAFVLQGEPT
jgi:CHAT domain-containing protein/tetratricopeptide (TPR) repeat protein